MLTWNVSDSFFFWCWVWNLGLLHAKCTTKLPNPDSDLLTNELWTEVANVGLRNLGTLARITWRRTVCETLMLFENWAFVGMCGIFWEFVYSFHQILKRAFWLHSLDLKYDDLESSSNLFARLPFLSWPSWNFIRPREDLWFPKKGSRYLGRKKMKPTNTLQNSFLLVLRVTGELIGWGNTTVDRWEEGFWFNSVHPWITWGAC